MKITANSLSDLKKVSQDILNHSKYSIYTFEGNIGVGKTTLIKEMCLVLGINEKVTSPSYSIVNEYISSEKSVYHFDFYRINDEMEAYDIGVEDYFYSGETCFIEWPEKIPSILPNQITRVLITIQEDEQRQYEIIF